MSALGPIADIATAASQCDRRAYDNRWPCDNRLGARLTVSERAICSVANGAVEIALAGRDNFGTAVTLALILFPRCAPLRHRFVPHCPCLQHFCPIHNDILIKTRKRDTRFLHRGRRTDYVMQNPAEDFTALGLTLESWVILSGLVLIVCIAVLAAKL
jgi:hypothetical protein